MGIFTENGEIFVALVVLAIVTTVSGFGIIKELGSVANKVLVIASETRAHLPRGSAIRRRGDAHSDCRYG